MSIRESAAILAGCLLKRSSGIVLEGRLSMDDVQAHGQEPSQRKLLIVDDEEKICRMLAQHFSFNGYEVRTVCRGEEALVLARIFHPHVVLLDLLMPGMNGVDTLKGLKQLIPPPKILMISAADHREVVHGALDLGADFYVCKPVDLSELDILVNGFCPPNTKR